MTLSLLLIPVNSWLLLPIDTDEKKETNEEEKNDDIIVVERNTKRKKNRSKEGDR